MILMYHKVSDEARSMWWVSANAFYRQMVQLQSKEVVYLDDYDPSNPNHAVITFDGIYTDVIKFALPILKKFDYPFELFFTSDWLGKDSSFDKTEPLTSFTTKKQLSDLVDAGGRLQWHTRTHRDLTKLTDSEVKEELCWPNGLEELDNKGFKWFAYPYGSYDDRSAKIVKEKFKGGLGTEKGSFSDNTSWPRITVTEKTELINEKISVIVPCYNYAEYLVEAVESLMRQSYMPNEIILSDDSSTDHSLRIMQIYRDKYPDLIKINHNSKNLGISKHFKKVVEMTHGDYICFLGADNRYGGDYIEQLFIELQKNKKAAIAYTDFILFGDRGKAVYSTFDDKFKDEEISPGVYKINFPSFTKESKKLLLSGKTNFIHGSSMYRRKAYEKVGGYKDRKNGPEDYTLFQAIVKSGWDAVKSKKAILEYRQHSSEQANNQFSYFSELRFLRKQVNLGITASAKVAAIEAENVAMHKEIEKMSKDFKEVNEAFIDTSKRYDKLTKKLSVRVYLKFIRVIKSIIR